MKFSASYSLVGYGVAREEGLSNIIYLHPKVAVMSGERAGKHGVPQGSWLYLVPCWSLKTCEWSQGWQSIPALLGGQYTSYVQGARPIQAREVADGNFRDGKDQFSVNNLEYTLGSVFWLHLTVSILPVEGSDSIMRLLIWTEAVGFLLRKLKTIWLNSTLQCCVNK